MGRYRGRCRVDGEDVGRWVVRAGWAFAYIEHSREYVGDEAEAHAGRLGIWKEEPPMPPWQWRRERRRSAAR